MKVLVALFALVSCLASAQLLRPDKMVSVGQLMAVVVWQWMTAFLIKDNNNIRLPFAPWHLQNGKDTVSIWSLVVNID